MKQPNFRGLGSLASWLLLAVLIPVGLSAQSGRNLSIGKTYKPPPIHNNDYFFQPAFALGLSFGTDAVPGIDASFQPVPWMFLRLGYHHLHFTLKDRVVNTGSFGFGDRDILVNSDILFSHVRVGWEVAPTKQHNWRLVLGLALGLDNQLTGKFEFKDPIQINDLEISPEEIGFIKGTYTTDALIYPYFGVGVGRSVPSRRVNVTCDVGTYYRGAPRFMIESTNLFENNEENAEVLERNFNRWRWQPSINIRVGFRIY